MGGLGIPFGGEAAGVEATEVSGASSAEGMQAQEADGSRGPRQSDAFSNPESCGTCLWDTGEAGGEADRPGDWSGKGNSQGRVEEFGLQLGSILRVGWDMSAPGISAGQNDPAGSLKGDQQGSSDRLCKMNDQFFYLTFLVNSIQ
jgi:hypothetical protein